MSTSFEVTFTMEQLFSDLEKDELEIGAYTIITAKIGDANAMKSIGCEYQIKKKKYDKAMAWYRLAAAKNNSGAQNNIGNLYGYGFGVPKNYLHAMEWWLKAATQNNKIAWENMGLYFESGRGVPVNKYKALEWYTKCGNKPDKVKAFTEQGIQLTEQDKNKPIELLIIETEDMVSAAKRKIMEELKDKESKTSLLEGDMESYRLAAEKKQLEIDTLLEAKNKREKELRAEVDSLQKSKIKVEEEAAARIKSLEEENKIYRLSLEQILTQLKVKMDEESNAKDHKMKSSEKDTQTYQVLPEQKQKQQQIDVFSAAKSERENQLREDINIPKQSNEESAIKIKSMKKESLTYQLTAEYNQIEVDDQREKVEQYKRDNEKLTNEIQLLKVANGIQTAQLEVKDSHIKSLENIITTLGSKSEKPTEDTSHIIIELKKSNEHLEKLFKQEQQLKDNEIKLIKQMIKALLSKEQGENHKWEMW